MSKRAEASGTAFWGDIDDTEARERYQTLVNAIGDGVYQLDADGQFAAVNDVLVEMTGYAREDLLGEHVSELHDDCPALEREIERIRTDPGDRGERYELDVRTAGGQLVPCEVRVNPLEADDTVQGVVGTVREHDERFRTGETESEHDERSRTGETESERERELAARSAARENTVDGVAILDENEEYVFANQAHADIYGYDDPETFLGESWRLCYDDDEIERFESEVLPALFEEGSWRGEATALCKDGSSFPQDLSLTELDDGRYVCVVRNITEQTEYQRELRRKERQFEAVFEDPNILAGLLEPDGTVLDINQTAMEYIDADLDDVTGEAFWETPWWQEDDGVQSDVEQWVERAAGGEYVDFEADLTRPDGTEYVLNGVFRPVTNDEDEVVSLIVSDRDITERRQHERELEESERRYRTLAEHFPNGAVSLVGEDLRYRTVGGSPLDVAGVPIDEIEGQSVHEALPEELADDLAPRYETALEGESNTFETELGDRVFQFQFVPVRDDDGEILAALGMSQDITERTERERELARYETIVETIDHGIYVKDDDGRFTMVNDAYADLTGYDHETLVGEHASLVDEDAIEQSREMRTTMDGEGTDRTMKAVIQTADGTSVPTERTFSTLQVGDGEERHVGVVRDITERIEQQRKVEESERRYRTLVENFPNGSVGLFDRDLRYTAVGGQLLDALDISPQNRVGSHIYDIHPDSLLDDIEPYYLAALEGETNTFEVEYGGRYLHANTLPVRDSEGEVSAGMLVVQDITERREAEHELRESEAKFRILAENLEEVVWMATPDAEEFIYINPAFEKVWEIDRKSLYDEPLSFLDVVHPDDHERVREEFTALPENDFDGEFRIVRPDGEIRWVHAKGTRVYDEDSEISRIVGTGQDITERKERERQLEESERRYRTLAEHFPNGAVGVYDPDLRYTLTAGAVLGDTLPSSNRLEGERMTEIFPPDTVEDLEPLFRAAVEDGTTDSARTEFGGRHWQVWVTPLRDADDEIFAGLSFTQDITEQVEREAELERTLDLLEKTERIADVGGWEIDPQTQDVFWTDHIFEVLDLPDDGEPPLNEAIDMYHEDDQPIVEDAVEDALASGDPFDADVRVCTDSGEMRWLRLQGIPETVDGDVVSFRGAAQDITEQVEREQRLEELIDELETSNERLEQFAYAASHDLQEPLRMVSSYLQLIEKRYADELDEDGQEFIDFAVDGADRMRDMIEGLLKYSRVDMRGNQFEAVELEEIFADVRSDLKVRIEESGAEITADPLPCVEGDEGQLRQVFQNLLSNAIEYSGEERPRIDVSAERNGSEWVISVSDEGIGIDPDDADRVFDVFQSLHASDTHSGTGIGLALCERIAERHDGEIWVDSAVGEGSTFSFTLPAESTYSE